MHILRNCCMRVFDALRKFSVIGNHTIVISRCYHYQLLKNRDTKKYIFQKKQKNFHQ